MMLLSCLSGHTYVYLCISLCWYDEHQHLIHHTEPQQPLSLTFLTSSPCLPITLPHSLLSLPTVTVVFRSPITTSVSLLPTLSPSLQISVEVVLHLTSAVICWSMHLLKREPSLLYLKFYHHNLSSLTYCHPSRSQINHLQFTSAPLPPCFMNHCTVTLRSYIPLFVLMSS